MEALSLIGSIYSYSWDIIEIEQREKLATQRSQGANSRNERGYSFDAHLCVRPFRFFCREEQKPTILSIEADYARLAGEDARVSPFLSLSLSLSHFQVITDHASRASINRYIAARHRHTISFDSCHQLTFSTNLTSHFDSHERNAKIAHTCVARVPRIEFEFESLSLSALASTSDRARPFVL